MLVISIGIGIFYAVKDALTNKSGDAAEFLMGGRKLTAVPVALSLLVSFVSAITVLGTTAEMYTAGTLFILGVIGVVFSNLITAMLFVHLLYPLQLTSSFEYLELRFQSRAAKLKGTLINVSLMIRDVPTNQFLAYPCSKHAIMFIAGAALTESTVVLYGGAGVGFAFAAQQLGGTVFQVSITFTGTAGGALLGVFFLGAVFPWANWIGCVVGGIVGLAFPLWLGIGANKLPKRGFALDFPTDNCSIAANTSVTMATMTTVSMTTSTVAPTVNEISGLDHLYTISYLYFASIAILTAMIVGLIVSFLTGETDPKYLIPVFDRLCCYLPKRVRRRLRCGLEFREPEDIADEEKRHKMDLTSADSYMYGDGQHVNPLFSGSHDGSQKGIALVSLTKSENKKY